MQKLIIDYQ